jgi:hypothetical protein
MWNEHTTLTNISTQTLYKEKQMEALAQKLRKAYDLIANADTSDIDAFYLAVEEAHGFIAEALDMVDNPERERMFVDDGRTVFFIDEHEVSCDEFNDYFDLHDVGWEEEVDYQGRLLVTIHTDDARS